LPGTDYLLLPANVRQPPARRSPGGPRRSCRDGADRVEDGVHCSL